MRRLEELLRQMCQAAKAIGNTELENKFAQGEIWLLVYHCDHCNVMLNVYLYTGIVKIKRDIVFAASLYL